MSSTSHGSSDPPSATSRLQWWLVWLPGFAVALGAAAATAHGLYEVAVAARVPAGLAWLYPLITDGLALVAYGATARLRGSGARYAWTVVVVAAALSGLAQAAFLATDQPAPETGSAPHDGAVAGMVAPPLLRFGIGAWPAIAAAVVAHLLYLLATDHPEPVPEQQHSRAPAPTVHATAEREPGVQASPRVHPRPYTPPARELEQGPAVQPAASTAAVSAGAVNGSASGVQGGSGGGPARERARAAATRHARHHGHLPTVTALTEAADVSRGTAQAALKDLREQPLGLHLITNTTADDPGTADSDPEPTQDQAQP